MSFNDDCEVPQRLAYALRCRLFPNSNLTPQGLAYALRVSERQVWSWLGGRNMPKGEYLLRLISFFDAGFVNALIAGHGAHVIKLSDKRAIDAARMIAEGAAILKAMEGGKCG